ncbi:MAG: hypothetical protein KIT84_04280 [Labilithrix sp.]|nr:hypothetical protein [Labilithrix sp.]MCW5810204.1 hypothetical protein [Labilithrix sp.]
MKITDPLEVEGIVPYDRFHIALMHTKGGQVHPTLKLAPQAAISGVADGDHFRARALFDGHFAVGPIDLSCDAIGLGDDNELDPQDLKASKNKLVPPKGRTYNATWPNTTPLLKASIAATDGLRLMDSYSDDGGLPYFSSAVFEVLEERQGHRKLRARTTGGTELTAWVKNDEMEPTNGGRGEGIGLCGCGRGPHPWRSKLMTLTSGASIHSKPNGPAWAKAPTPVKLYIEPEPQDDWRKVTTLDRLSEGGAPCPTERLEHAWVRAADLQ